MSATCEDLTRECRHAESPRHPLSACRQATEKAGPRGQPAPAGPGPDAWAGRPRAAFQCKLCGPFEGNLGKCIKPLKYVIH